MTEPRRRVRIAAVGAVLFAVGTMVPSSAAADASACATRHLGVRWGRFQPPVKDYGTLAFYHAPEGAGNVGVSIFSSGEDCDPPREPVVAQYRIDAPPPGTSRPATPPADFQAKVGTTPPLWDVHGGQTEHADTVVVPPDAAPLLPEPVVEQAQAVITSSTGRRDYPSNVPLYVVDVNGDDRASFGSSGPFERAERYFTIDVPVFRAGPALGTASFNYTVSGSGPAPATPGSDLRVASPQPLTFEAGERLKLIRIELGLDNEKEPTEEATITLTNAGTVLPEDPVSATISILDGSGEASSGATSSLHHPRQKNRYASDDYKIREIHIFTNDQGGPAVTAADFALRRNMKGKKCAWWTGKKFRKGSCKRHRWLNTGQFERDFYYYRMNRSLPPSTGKTLTYTAFSRAIDGTGRAEAEFKRGRNANTFEVKAGKR